ncbi:ABC transporter permease [Actinoplanes utahensis]|uniref:ABC transporter permease n=1 Tax=Actinoplanes utahensis TaxID=1869 RepID=A0A0A6UKF9_ACTUT|nr:ABC-2 family transporter protein [Actinoplanes utahensis]KHD76610.1 ABC transporter permease [Actinoplanes utahensis]GIF31308.1 transporter [Actinoplanes utahensis]
MGELRAYAALASAQIRSAATYRSSFLVELFGNMGATVFDVLTVLVLFRATPAVGGFSLWEAILIVGLSSAGFALADFAVGNVDRLKTFVRAGTMDSVLVRPLRALPQLLLMDLPVRKVLRVALGFTVLGVALAANDIDWTPPRVLLVVLAPVTAAVFFGSIFVISASLAFWWVDSGEIGSAFTYGGRDFTSYPITVYGPWFRNLFAYTLGFAFVAYQPALALLGRPDPLGLPAWAGFLSPLVALGAVVVAAAVWRAGIRHYRSTGS